jgi:hypothetical protein
MKICSECHAVEGSNLTDPICILPDTPHVFADVTIFPKGTIRTNVDGIGDLYQMVAGHTGTKIKVFVRERATNTVKEYKCEPYEELWDRGRFFWWSNGNGACDANRMRAFGRRQESDVCNHSKPEYDVEISRADNGQVIYTEWACLHPVTFSSIPRICTQCGEVVAFPRAHCLPHTCAEPVCSPVSNAPGRTT